MAMAKADPGIRSRIVETSGKSRYPPGSFHASEVFYVGTLRQVCALSRKAQGQEAQRALSQGRSSQGPQGRVPHASGQASCHCEDELSPVPRGHSGAVPLRGPPHFFALRFALVCCCPFWLRCVGGRHRVVGLGGAGRRRLPGAFVSRGRVSTSGWSRGWGSIVEHLEIPRVSRWR